MLEARKFSLVQRPWLTTCRPVLRAFTSRAQARVLCTATHDIVQEDDRELMAAFEGPSATRVPPPVAVLKQATELEDRDGASAEDTQTVLRSLIARVHQGCRLLLEAGKPEQCLALLDASAFLIVDAPLSDGDLATQLLSQLIPRVNTEAALSALRMVAPSAGAYRAALRAFAAKGGTRGVGEVVNAALRERLLQGPESRELWLAAITAFGKVGQLDNVRWAFKTMRRQGAWTLEDTHGANIMLHALHTDTLLTFTRFQQLVAEGMRPDTSTFNVLLKACMRSKDARRAELTLRWMRKARMRGDETTYNTLIKTFSYAGEFEKVLSVRELMRRQRFEPTPRIWGSLLVACGAAGHLETAAVLWAELKERDRQLAAATGGAAGAVASGEPGAASSSSSGGGGGGGDSSSPEAPEGSQSAVVPAQLAGAASSPSGKGNSGRAAEGSGGAAGGLLTTEVFNALMTACIDSYQGERALTVFEELRSASPRVRPDLRSYNLAIKGCESPPTKTLRPQQLATAMSLLEELRAQGLAPDEYTYGTLIDLCARAKNGPQALALYEEMQQRGIKPNKTLVTSLFKALGASGMVDDCMRIFRKIVWGPARVRPNAATFRALVHALKENGELGEALRVYQGMREVGHPANNQEFTELVSAAAEHALRHRDAALQQQVLALAEVAPCPRELDLHGMSSTEARAAVLCVLSSAQQAYLQAQAQQAGQAQQGGDGGASSGSGPADARVASSSSSSSGWEAHDITIITGCGRNSAAGEAVLPGVVLKLVREELGIAVQCSPPPGGSAADANASASASANAAASGSHEQGADATVASASAAEAAGAASAVGQGGDAARAVNSGRLIITRQALQQWLEGKKGRSRGDSSVSSMSSVDCPPPSKSA